MDQASRLELVAETLRAGSFGSQQNLWSALRRRGLPISTSTLSRDLKQLGVRRIRTADGVFAYRMPEARPVATSAASYRRRFNTSVTGIRRSGFVVLVFTPPGEAQLVGRLLDAAALPGLLGTVAGDDTVIGIAEDVASARQLEAQFQEMLR